MIACIMVGSQQHHHDYHGNGWWVGMGDTSLSILLLLGPFELLASLSKAL